MNIQATKSNLMTNMVTAQIAQGTIDDETKTGEKYIADYSDTIHVTISEEGMNNYKDSVKDDMSPFDEMIKMRDDLISNPGVILIDYAKYYYSACNSFSPWSSSGITEKAEGAVKAYASLYDDIIKRHEGGGEGFYVEDKSTIEGYRKMTKEEEIDTLNSLLNQRADELKAEIENRKIEAGAYERYIHNFRKYASKGNMAEKLEKWKKIVETIREQLELVPDDIDEQVKMAGHQFVQKYDAGMNIDKFLQTKISFEAKH